MPYDAAQFLAATEPPQITVPRGRLGRWLAETWLGKLLNLQPTKTYVGRILSHREFLRFRELFIRMAKGELEEEEVIGFCRDYLLEIDIPPSVILDLPPVMMLEAMHDFFRCQQQMTPTMEWRPRSMSGNSSPPKDEDEPKERAM